MSLHNQNVYNINQKIRNSTHLIKQNEERECEFGVTKQTKQTKQTKIK